MPTIQLAQYYSYLGKDIILELRRLPHAQHVNRGWNLYALQGPQGPLQLILGSTRDRHVCTALRLVPLQTEIHQVTPARSAWGFARRCMKCQRNSTE